MPSKPDRQRTRKWNKPHQSLDHNSLAILLHRHKTGDVLVIFKTFAFTLKLTPTLRTHNFYL